jgi:hypothetical protein
MNSTKQARTPTKFGARRLGNWIACKLFKIDVYELQRGEVVIDRRREPIFRIQDVSTWQQVFICFGVSVIKIKFVDGRTVEFSDKHENLLHILQHSAPKAELPWKAI